MQSINLLQISRVVKIADESIRDSGQCIFCKYIKKTHFKVLKYGSSNAVNKYLRLI